MGNIYHYRKIMLNTIIKYVSRIKENSRLDVQVQLECFRAVVRSIT